MPLKIYNSELIRASNHESNPSEILQTLFFFAWLSELRGRRQREVGILGNGSYLEVPG